MSGKRGSVGKYDTKILDLYNSGFFTLDPSDGKIFGKRGKEIGCVKRGAKGTTPYVKVCLPVRSGRGHQRSHWCHLHRIIAICCFGLPKGLKTVVNHKDGNGLNNKRSNLEWCTPKQNTQHAIHVTGTFSQNGSKNRQALIDEAQAKEIMLSPKTDKYLAKHYGVGWKTIQTIRYGMRWRSVFDVVSKLPEFEKAKLERLHRTALRKSGLTRKVAHELVTSTKTAKELTKLGVREHIVYRLRTADSWQWLRDEVQQDIPEDFNTRKMTPDKAKKIFRAAGTNTEISKAFSVTVSQVQKIKARITFAPTTKGLKRG